MKAFMYLFNLRWQGGVRNGDRWCWCRRCGAVQGQDAGRDGYPCEALGGESLWHQEERPRHLQIQGVGPRPPKREEMRLVFPEEKNKRRRTRTTPISGSRYDGAGGEAHGACKHDTVIVDDADTLNCGICYLPLKPPVFQVRTIVVHARPIHHKFVYQ